MNGKGRTIVIGLVLVTLLASLGATASAATRYVKRTVRVPYTYHEWETVTRYRTVRRAVTRTRYRLERRIETTYETRRRPIARSRVRFWGIFGRGRVFVEVRIPVETVVLVRVPYEETVYEDVEEPYTERIRVERTGYRLVTRRIVVEIPAPHVSISFGHRPSRPDPPKHKTVRKTKQIVQAPGAAHPTVLKTRTERVTSHPWSGGTKTVIRTKEKEKTKGVPKNVTRSKRTIRRQ
jgi:hypothetical protein